MIPAHFQRLFRTLGWREFYNQVGQKRCSPLWLWQPSQWLAENKGALDEYNRRIDSRGIFNDGLRRY